jgi:hypothetical protein
MNVNGHLHASAALAPGKTARYPMHRRLGGPHSWSRRCGEEINHLPLPRIEPSSSSPWPVAIPTELSSEILVTIYKTTWYHNPKDHILNARFFISISLHVFIFTYSFICTLRTEITETGGGVADVFDKNWKWSWPDWGTDPVNEKPHDSQFSGRDSNRAPPEYKSTALLRYTQCDN